MGVRQVGTAVADLSAGMPQDGTPPTGTSPVPAVAGTTTRNVTTPGADLDRVGGSYSGPPSSSVPAVGAHFSGAPSVGSPVVGPADGGTGPHFFGEGERSPDRETVRIAVADQGIGIPARDLDRIFERFYRVDHGRSRDTGGTGLGLSIVRHVANNHQGWVDVESREGEGSVFTLVLPLQPDRPS
jgi:histidine kinase/DNA gyrase B/HSP90-like ATPase